MAESSKTSLVKKVKCLQEKLGLPQEELARLVNVSNNVIINIQTKAKASNMPVGNSI